MDDRYVKITLPDGVLETNSTLAELQTKFEEILIKHGLLEPASDPPPAPKDSSTSTHQNAGESTSG